MMHRLIILSSLILFSVPAASQDLWVEKTNKKGTTPSVTKLAKRTSPAVVNVIVSFGSGISGLLEGPFSEGSSAQGSGFIINPSGLMLTNAHVVENASQIRVRLLDKSEHEAKVIGLDTGTDLALLKIEPVKAIKFPTIPLGDSDGLQVGEGVVAIGNPLGLSHSVTSGIVSALGRRNLAPQGREMYTDFIQTDASINPGNSGGPLINLAGEVIGINTAINKQGQGIGFAIPINIVKVLVPQLHSRGYVVRSWIGVRVQKVSTELARSFGMERTVGALVTEVIKDGPAEKGGVQIGDVITKFRGKDVVSSDALPWLAATSTTKKPVDVELFREGKPIKIAIQLEELPDQKKSAIPKQKPIVVEKSVELGLTLEPLSSDEMVGVIVAKISEKSPTVKSGLRRRDLIRSVMGVEVSSIDTFEREMKKYQPGDVVRFKVMRAGRTVFIAFER